MATRAFITGIAGTVLSPAERAFVRESEPWGCILFERNVESPAQLCRLTAAFREAVNRNAPVLVDQEGGRVQRLGPPQWPAYPAAAAYGRMYDRDSARAGQVARAGACLMAADLAGVGIDVNCVPVADVPVDSSDPVIGERAFGKQPGKVAELARSFADGLLASGVLPVLKHIPGHGRAAVDSHRELPVVQAPLSVLQATDFAAFRPLAHLPLGMTAHVVYTAIDSVAPATTSATLVREVIRNWIGFDGLLMSDDISMGALCGSIAERSRAAISAGCDVVLHCNGNMQEMEQVAASVPELAGRAVVRAEAALARRTAPKPDLATLRAQWSALMKTAVEA
jgi:beta-N-acetylhexosaminidase